ncbi:unnamed protein product [Prunus armeniaca]
MRLTEMRRIDHGKSYNYGSPCIRLTEMGRIDHGKSYKKASRAATMNFPKDIIILALGNLGSFCFIKEMLSNHRI